MPRFSFALSILVLHFTFHSIQAQPGETKTGTATISGRVTLKGEPARGVMVILLTDIRWSANAPRARPDENGRFSFTNLAAGKYSISAVAPGYVSPEGGTYFMLGLHGEAINVADGEKIENVDLEIKRGGVIAGRIRDTQGRPVIEEPVTVSRLDRNNKPQPYFSFSPTFDMRLTDDRGVYRIYGLPEGRYLVSVGQTPGADGITWSRAFYPRVFYPNATSESEAKVIEVSEGAEATDVDITVPDPKETHNVFGRVVDAGTEQPVDGMKVEVGGVSSDGLSRDEREMDDLQSGPNGEFRFFGLLPGKYALFVRPRFNDGFISEPVIFDISDGDATGIELKVRQGTASISGVVVIEGANDPKVLAKLPQVYVVTSIDLADPKLGSSVEMLPVKVNTDGSFRINGVPAGKVKIRRWNQDHTDFLVARIEHNGTPAGKGIEIDAGEQVTGVRIVLHYGALTLRGEMKFIGGTLPDGYQFAVMARRTDQNVQYERGAVIDARGQFTIENLAPGEYEISVIPGHRDPEIRRRFSSVKKRVFVGSGNQQPVTFVVDLSRKEEDK
jgi:Carboxypeptidase regulatory-like domain